MPQACGLNLPNESIPLILAITQDFKKQLESFSIQRQYVCVSSKGDLGRQALTHRDY
jgi:hypothetical protein